MQLQEMWNNIKMSSLLKNRTPTSAKSPQQIIY